MENEGTLTQTVVKVPTIVVHSYRPSRNFSISRAFEWLQFEGYISLQ